MTTGRILACTVLATALLAIAYVYRTELAAWIEDLERQTANLGYWGPLAFFVLFIALTSLFFPDSVLVATAGVLFGTLLGTVTCFAGTLVVQSVAFFLSRRFLQGRVTRFIEGRPKLAVIPRVVDQQGFRLQVLLRLTPLNPVLLSYLLGTTKSRFGSFFLACMALGPVMFVQAYCGYAAKHMIKAAGRPHGHSWLETALVGGGLVACLVFLSMIIRVAKKAIADAERQSR
ncbi:MAG: TVP38/TMEM64 family protein [Planctomycetales bacterium]|nr:TVP38/TMEM64 family protein [Planctomycetales bacterium]